MVEAAAAAAQAVSDRRLATALAALGLSAGIVYLLAGMADGSTAATSLPLDEAWARLVYARAFAQTGGLQFNDGTPDVGVGSLLWVFLLGLLIKTLGSVGVSVVALAKGVSLLAGAALAPLAAGVVRHLGNSRLAALTAGALVALDPELGFASASGLEATLFAALLLASYLAFLAGRRLSCGILLALALLARLEGLILVALIVAAALPGLVRAVSAGGNAAAVARLARDRRALAASAAALAAPLAAVAIWLGANGTRLSWIFPRYPDARAPHAPDLIGLWRGYVDPAVGVLGDGAWLVALPVAVLGGWSVARSRGMSALPLLAFPFILAVGTASVAPLARGPWPFDQRNHLDPVLPFVAILFALGLPALWERARHLVDQRVPVGSSHRGAWAIGAVGASMLAMALPVAAQIGLWAHLPADYVRGGRALNETYFALALAARGVVPDSAVIGALDPGALRYVSRRPVVDLSGQHTPAVQSRDPIDALAESRPEYAALPLVPRFESLPGATLLGSFGETGARLGLFKLAARGSISPRDQPYSFPTDGLRRLDYLDVANEASERTHSYSAPDAAATERRASRLNESASVDDDGRAFSTSESFELQAEAGRDLVLARRYDATVATGFRVTIDGQPAGDWYPRGGRYVMAEETIRIRGALVRRNRVAVVLQVLPGQPAPATSYSYWTFVDR